MKTNVVIILATVLFLSACSNKFSLVKRKYNKGFYVSVNKKATEPRVQERVTHKPVGTHEKVAEVVMPSKTQKKCESISSDAIPLKNNLNLSTGNSHATAVKPEKNVIATTNNQNISFETSKTIKPVIISDYSTAGTDSDTMLILLVILAIIIPPLAVYLKNKSIDMWFWITLICFVVGWGVFFGGVPFGGALSLAAIVIALLYVFDVIK